MDELFTKFKKRWGNSNIKQTFSYTYVGFILQRTNLKILFFEFLDHLTVANLLYEQPDRQTDPGTTEK